MCQTSARLDGKFAIVTGGSSGIGYEAAKNLVKRGARVVIASRNETKLIRARDLIRKSTGSNRISYDVVDLASLKSVRSFAANVLQNEDQLDVLVNNAGAVLLPDRLTEDCLNLTMQVNFFGTFLLTYLLLPLLKKSAPSRIINGLAAAMYIGRIEFDHWNDIGRYTPVESLANSKLAIALFSAELNRKFEGSGVSVNTFDPFVARDTDILNNVSGIAKNVSRLFVDLIGQPKEDIGQQIAYLAADPKFDDTSGKHYKFCTEWINHWLVSDEVLTSRLWEESKKVVQVTDEESWD
ncbi:retinol dehydrogenase 13-like [Aricia agestis]|uniref:retinol dehydrogenase 13-like n=1 Tax=Aricia agestis TaxID=91739 RepID=UPI001C2099D0|nr:retinol dehydrogenase 13-like [Aricia agestis]